jgi:hypothetical protein
VIVIAKVGVAERAFDFKDNGRNISGVQQYKGAGLILSGLSAPLARPRLSWCCPARCPAALDPEPRALQVPRRMRKGTIEYKFCASTRARFDRHNQARRPIPAKLHRAGLINRASLWKRRDMVNRSAEMLSRGSARLTLLKCLSVRQPDAPPIYIVFLFRLKSN